MRSDDKFDYLAGGFTEADQRRVADLMRELDARGCLVMASNADCSLVRELYRGYRIEPLTVHRQVGGHVARRGAAQEVVVRNYEGDPDALPGL